MKLEDLSQLKGHTFVLDVETTGLRWWENGLIGIGIYCPELGIEEYIPTCTYEQVPTGKAKKKKEWTGEYEIVPGTRRKKKVYREWLEQTTRLEAVPIPEMREDASSYLARVAADPKTCIIAHNAKFDLHFLALDLWNMPCKLVDTTVLIHLYDSRLPKAMDKAEEYWLGSESKRDHKEQVIKLHKNYPWLWTLEQVRDYCINDCIVTYQLAQVIMPELRKLQLVDLFRVQMKYLRCLWRIERRGMELDKDFCHQALESFTKNLELMEKDLKQQVNEARAGKLLPEHQPELGGILEESYEELDFNWKSHAQLSKAIYDEMGIPKPINPFADEDGVDRTRFAFRGRYNSQCTSSFLLMEKANHPLGELILDMRETDKLRKGVEGYLELAQVDGVIHTNFRPTGTRTGRLSSGEPNVQNIASQHRVRETQSIYSGGAIREDAYNLRTAFRARAGYSFVSIDHKQQEQKVFAILSNEPIMLEALRNRQDIHLMIAIAVWGDCGPERNKLHREWSKTISFGLLYGMTVGSLQFRLNKTPEEANEITEMYWKTFPRIQPYLREVIQNVKEHGRVRYWSGRIWREEEPDDMYKGCNAQIQGGAADFIQLACIRSQHVLEYQQWGSVASIIHDELLCEVRDDKIEQATPILVKIMECEDVFGLPFAADVKIGKTYGDQDEYKLSTSVNLDTIDWLAYCAPNFKLEDYSLVPWKAGRI